MERLAWEARRLIERATGCYSLFMFSVSHDRGEESAEAKVRWFRSLPLSERMSLLCAFTNLALSANPRLADERDARPARGRIQIVSAV
jgi:hypothetical protein